MRTLQCDVQPIVWKVSCLLLLKYLRHGIEKWRQKSVTTMELGDTIEKRMETMVTMAKGNRQQLEYKNK